MSRKAKEQYPLVKISWTDAWGSSSWTDINEAAEKHAKGAPCVSVGFLLEETPDGYLIASTISERDVNGMFFIPASFAQRVKRV